MASSSAAPSRRSWGHILGGPIPNFSGMKITAIVAFFAGLLRKESLDRIKIGAALYQLKRFLDGQRNPQLFNQITANAGFETPGQVNFYIRVFQRMAHAGPNLNKFRPGALKFLCVSKLNPGKRVCNEAIAMSKSRRTVTLRDVQKIYVKYHKVNKLKANGQKRGLTWRIVKTPMATGVEVKLDFKNLAMRKFLSKAIKLKADLKMEMASGKGIKSMVRLTITKKGKQLDQIVY